jgi:hypothetical protein
MVNTAGLWFRNRIFKRYVPGSRLLTTVESRWATISSLEAIRVFNRTLSNVTIGEVPKSSPVMVSASCVLSRIALVMSGRSW